MMHSRMHSAASAGVMKANVGMRRKARNVSSTVPARSSATGLTMPRPHTLVSMHTRSRSLCASGTAFSTSVFRRTPCNTNARTDGPSPRRQAMWYAVIWLLLRSVKFAR